MTASLSYCVQLCVALSMAPVLAVGLGTMAAPLSPLLGGLLAISALGIQLWIVQSGLRRANAWLEQAASAFEGGAGQQRLAPFGPARLRRAIDALNRMLEQRDRLDEAMGVRERKLEEALAQLRRMSRQLVDVQERERRAIAHELHDQIGQALTAAAMRLRLLLRRHGIDPRSEDAERLTLILDGALADIRELTRSLRPAQLDHLGLASALQDLARRLFEGTGIRCKVAADAIGQPPEAVAVALYRIAQEALANVVRHADASEVRVSAGLEQDSYVLQVANDGSGFVGNHAPMPGLAAEGIHERAALLGGSAAIRAGPGLGTIVEVRLPLRV